MTKRLLIPSLLLGLLLTACGGEPATAPDAAAPAAEAPAAPAGEAIADEPALDPAAAPAAGEPAGDDAATTDAAEGDTPAPGEPVAAAPAPAAPSGPALVPGTDYVEIPGGQPFAPLDGKIEVVEVFAYSCGHCAAFDPLVNAWKKRLPSDVRFTLLPAAFNPADNFPKAFFAVEALGAVDRVHTPLFNAMHIERSLRPNASTDDIVAFLSRHGVDAAQLRGTIDSFAVNAKVARTRQFMMRSGVDATPTMLVNGRYRVRGRTLEDVLRITDQLVAQERAAAAQASGTH